MDVTGDGKPDLVSVQRQDLVVQAGQGDGTFGAPQHTTVFTLDASSNATTALADLDGDGALDAVSLVMLQPSFSVLFGQHGAGTVTWSPGQMMPLPSYPVLVLIGDYNQDGILDVAVGYSSSLVTELSIFQGIGNRSFQALPPLALPAQFALATQGDFNGDGVLDLVAYNSTSATDNLLVLLGIGGGRFLTLPAQSVAQSVTLAAAGDWDGDGKQDLVTVSLNQLCALHSL